MPKFRKKHLDEDSVEENLDNPQADDFTDDIEGSLVDDFSADMPPSGDAAGVNDILAVKPGSTHSETDDTDLEDVEAGFGAVEGQATGDLYEVDALDEMIVAPVPSTRRWGGRKKRGVAATSSVKSSGIFRKKASNKQGQESGGASFSADGGKEAVSEFEDSSGKRWFGSGKQKKIVIIDGNWTAVVTTQKQTIKSVVETEHDSSSKATNAAKRLAKNNNKCSIVWCNKDQKYARSQASDVVLHPTAEAEEAKATQATMFEHTAPTASQLLSDGARAWVTIGSNAPAWVDGNVMPSALLVGEAEGAWLRVGWDATEMVYRDRNGDVSAYECIGAGITDVEQRISELIPKGQRGADTTLKIRSDYYRSLAQQVNLILSRWQSKNFSAKQIWLHGPGVESSKDLSAHITAQTGIPVQTDELEGWNTPDFSLAWLTSATAALRVGVPPICTSTQMQIRLIRKKKMLMWGSIGTVLLAVFGLMGYLSFSEGSRINSRVADAERRSAEAQAIIDKNQVLATSEEEIAAAEKLAQIDGMRAAIDWAHTLDGESEGEEDLDARALNLFNADADWESLFEFWEAWFFAPQGLSSLYDEDIDKLSIDIPLGFSLSGNSWGFQFDSSGVGVGGNLGLRSEMDLWAQFVWGECAVTLSGGAVEVKTDGLSDLAVEVQPDLECLRERITKIDEEAAAAAAESEGEVLEETVVEDVEDVEDSEDADNA